MPLVSEVHGCLHIWKACSINRLLPFRQQETRTDRDRFTQWEVHIHELTIMPQQLQCLLWEIYHLPCSTVKLFQRKFYLLSSSNIAAWVPIHEGKNCTESLPIETRWEGIHLHAVFILHPQQNPFGFTECFIACGVHHEWTSLLRKQQNDRQHPGSTHTISGSAAF